MIMPKRLRKRAVSSSDVARKVGLSRSTVSFVLNNRQDISIPPATRRRVLRAAAELGYRPNAIARFLAKGRTSTIGVIVPAVELSSSADILSGVEAGCSRENHRMLLAYSHNDPDREVQQAELLLEHRVDGIICVVGYLSLLGTGQWVRRAQEAQVPCIILDSSVPGVEVDYVVGDDRLGAIAAVNHLIRLGHRSIGHLSAGDLSLPARERREGYLAALTAAGIQVDPSLIAGNSFEPGAGAAAMAALLSLSKPPTAVFAADDLMAASAIEVCLQSAVRVPEDLAVVGFNDTVLAQYLHLTTVHLSALERGQLAIQRLFARIENPYLPVEGITVPTRLVIRQSCGARLASTPP